MDVNLDMPRKVNRSILLHERILPKTGSTMPSRLLLETKAAADWSHRAYIAPSMSLLSAAGLGG